MLCIAAHEALTQGKPVVCVPMLLDQHDVAARVQDARAGVVVKKNPLTGTVVFVVVIVVANVVIGWHGFSIYS